MTDHYILGGKDGKEVAPATTEAWARTFDSAHRHIATEHIKANRLKWALGLAPDYRVSTVFLGIDHNFDGGPPLLFETMVFRRWPAWKRWISAPGQAIYLSKPPPLWLLPLFRRAKFGNAAAWFPRFKQWSEWADLDCERCSTWKQAEKQHEKVVAKWKKISKGSHYVTD